MQVGRFGVWALAATLSIGGVALAADALVETDEERVGELADAMTGPRPGERIADVLSWVDPSRVPLVVRAGGQVERFGDEGEDPGDAVREALAPLAAGDASVVQRSVSIEGDEAHLSTRARVQGGLLDVDVALARDGQAWWIRELRVLD